MLFWIQMHIDILHNRHGHLSRHRDLHHRWKGRGGGCCSNGSSGKSGWVCLGEGVRTHMNHLRGIATGEVQVSVGVLVHVVGVRVMGVGAHRVHHVVVHW